jgi:hypothetical protein
MATKATQPKRAKPKPTLNPKQEMFVRYYTGELFGNATMSYAMAYEMNLEQYSREPQKDDEGNVIEISEYQKHLMTCMVNGSRLLRVAKVAKKVNAILDKKFNDTEVDREHSKLIFQNDDLHVKLGGIKEFNRVRGRVKEKDDIPAGASPVTGITIVVKK